MRQQVSRCPCHADRRCRSLASRRAAAVPAPQQQHAVSSRVAHGTYASNVSRPPGAGVARGRAPGAPPRVLAPRLPCASAPSSSKKPMMDGAPGKNKGQSYPIYPQGRPPRQQAFDGKRPRGAGSGSLAGWAWAPPPHGVSTGHGVSLPGCLRARGPEGQAAGGAPVLCAAWLPRQRARAPVHRPLHLDRDVRAGVGVGGVVRWRGSGWPAGRSGEQLGCIAESNGIYRAS
ncbi:hypothetical protein U9M48_006456 [Paspalum notatum var. saurae]|uniref:Uncharacterized protein n=1 Tax=Paspalum notatum var. saurae TaxID=547442 RepID=A0AAQ3PS90_PASNO